MNLRTDPRVKFYSLTLFRIPNPIPLKVKDSHGLIPETIKINFTNVFVLKIIKMLMANLC